MAIVTEPIALDRSLNTTEQTPRNLADVLAQALQALNTTISGLNFINCVVVQTLPTADISTTTIYLVPKNPAQTDNLYDEYINLTGTSAGWEKIGDTEIDLSDYYNKTETDTLLSGKVDKVNGKGLSTNDYTTAEKTKLAGIEAGAEVNPTSGVKTATESFETVDGGLLSKCMIDLVPVQSGSGDPYPAGGGKNKLENTATSTTINNVTFTVNPDGSVLVNTTGATATALFTLNRFNDMNLPDGTYAFNGCPSGGSTSTHYLQVTKSPAPSIADIGNGNTFVIGGDYSVINIRIVVENGAVVNNALFKPMIRLATETDPTFAPYSNIRPISGHTEVDLLRCGKNWCPNKMLTTTRSGITATKNDDGTYTFNGTATAQVDFYMTIPNGTSGDVVDIPDDTYTFSGISGGSNTTYRLYVIVGSSPATYYGINSDKANFSSNGYAVNMFLRVYSGAVLNNVVIKPMICLASDPNPTDFEPYLGHLYQVQIGSTVYGGYVDLVSGVMTATYGIVDLGSLSWAYATPANVFYSADITDEKRVDGITCMCSSYTAVTNKTAISQMTINNTTALYALTSNHRVYVKDDRYSDPDVFKTAVSGVQFIYELATPLTIQLTPQQIEILAGQNNLSTPLDGQSIETNGVEYKELFTFADVKEYVDKKIPDAPTTDGTYTLQAVVSGGVPTYSWT